MSRNQAVRPYSTLPETYVLLAVVVWIDLMAAAWPNVTERGFLLRATSYAVLLGMAATHSWLMARRHQMGAGAQMGYFSLAWLIVLGSFVAGLEWRSAVPAFGILAFLQITQTSFMLNHATLKLTHLCAFVVMLIASPNLSLAGGGLAWVSFFAASLFLMAYDRTAQKAGPTGFNRGERRQTGQRLTVASGMAILVALVFMTVPLIRWPSLPKLPRLNLFESTLAPNLTNDEIMRVKTYPAVAGPLYLRGQAYDSFDGVRWYNSEKSEFSLPVKENSWARIPNSDIPVRLDKSRRVTQVYEMLVDMHEVVFTIGRPTNLQFSDRGVSRVRVGSSDQTLKVDQLLKTGTTYTVESYQDVFPERMLQNASYTTPDENLNRYLKPTPGMSPVVYDKARSIVAGLRSPYEKAVAIETHLRNNYAYSLTHDVHGPQVVTDFLLRTKKGHCALFASAMVVMARSQGLPARYVSGFVAQTPTDNGFLVRSSDGHAWVEVYIAGAGWISFDPTSSRIDANDPGTMDLTRNEGHQDVRVTGELQEGGGLYGRRQNEESGDPGDMASNGGQGQQSGGRTDHNLGPIESPDDGNGSTDGGSTPDGSDSSTGSTDPNSPSGDGGQNSGETRGNDTSPGTGSGGGNSPRVTVNPPGGDTSLPSNSRQLQNPEPPSLPFFGSTSPESSTPNKEAARERRNDPEKLESDWRFVLYLLVILGAVGFLGMVVWTWAVRPAVDQRRIREALPLAVDEDPDPRRFIVKLYHTMVSGLTRVGIVKREADTPAEFVEVVAQRGKDIEPPVADLTELFQVARYDHSTVTNDEAARARDAWRRIATGVKRIEPEEA